MKLGESIKKKTKKKLILFNNKLSNQRTKVRVKNNLLFIKYFTQNTSGLKRSVTQCNNNLSPDFYLSDDKAQRV